MRLVNVALGCLISSVALADDVRITLDKTFTLRPVASARRGRDQECTERVAGGVLGEVDCDGARQRTRTRRLATMGRAREQHSTEPGSGIDNPFNTTNPAHVYEIHPIMTIGPHDVADIRADLSCT